MVDTENSNDLTKLSSLLQSKYDHAFNLLYDTTHDKRVDNADCVKLLRKIAQIREISMADPMFKDFQERVTTIWAALMKGTCHYTQSKFKMHITLPEWRRHWGDFVEAANEAKGWPDKSKDGQTDYKWQRDYMDFWFEIIDTNGDGVIDKDEYVRCFSMFDVNPTLCEKSFDAITQGKTPTINRDQFEQLWYAYLTSDDELDPGNDLLPGRF